MASFLLGDPTFFERGQFILWPDERVVALRPDMGATLGELLTTSH